MMKYCIYLACCLLPLPATASVLLANCDHEPHTVLIRNGGSERTVTITRESGEIEEFGPMVSFQIVGTKDTHPIVKPLSPYEEFCIWNGAITVQRLNTGGAASAGVSIR